MSGFPGGFGVLFVQVACLDGPFIGTLGLCVLFATELCFSKEFFDVLMRESMGILVF